MKWQYKEEWFESIPFDWSKFWRKYFHVPLSINEKLKVFHPNIVEIPWISVPKHLDILVYVPKYNKCYTIQRFGIMGNGNKLKMYLEDVYTKNQFYVMAKDVELVVKI